MKKGYVSLLAFVISSCLCMDVCAQNDSAWLDAGTLKLNREFTQTISIKGEDLEKMPFANLADAINVWLYGAYTIPGTLLYVVDGVALGDVNAYSVYDIEEVVFVQDAQVDLNGVSGQQQLVLITTRKKAGGKKGITVAAQSALVNRNFGQLYPSQGVRSNTNLYQQYYGGLNKEFKHIGFGISVDYLRDVMPSVKADSVQTPTPFHLNRFRLNGYLNLKLGTANAITLRINYAPESLDSAQHFTYFNTPGFQEVHEHQIIFNPSLKWHSDLSNLWKNDLEISWVSTTNKLNGQFSNLDTFFPPPSQNITNFADSQDAEHYLIRERLSFMGKVGDWTLAPAWNFSYEHIKEGIAEGYASSSSLYPGSVTTGETTEGEGGKLYVLTTSLFIGYRNAFGFQGGMLSNLSRNDDSTTSRFFPFASLSVNILKWCNPKSGSDLKLFGSIAKAPNWYVHDYALVDLASGNGIVISPPPSYYTNIYAAPGTEYIPNRLINAPNNSSYKSLEAGLVWSSRDSRFQASYNFERRLCQVDPAVDIYGFYGGPGPTLEYGFWLSDLTATTHRLGLMAQVLEGQGLHWRSGLNISTMSAKGNLPYTVTLQYITGNFNTHPTSWTGGWVNSLSYKEFSLGLNVLYHYNEVMPANNYYGSLPVPAPVKINSLMLQNIYLSYRLRVAGGNSIELYLDGRSLFQNSESDLGDGRRYFGVGGKMGI